MALSVRKSCLLVLAAALVLTLPIGSAVAQAAAASVDLTKDIADSWQGTLHVGKDLRLVLKIAKAPDGTYKAQFFSVDQGGQALPIKSITLQGNVVKMNVELIGGTYEGKLSADGKSMTGTWTQGPNPIPLEFVRATVETAWAIPVPPPPLPPMAANANPTFEVATIKPSKPDAKGIGFRVNGRRFATFNTPLSAILSFAYGIHPKQIVGAPAWITEDKFDIEATPDGEGAPSDKQWKAMLQKLVAERFKLSFHHEKRELSVYVLSVGKAGVKLTKSEGDPNGLPGNFFTKLGNLNNRNSTLGDFTQVMQAAVMDRPVVDQTGITGRYDFTLTWTPDDSQFGGMGMKAPAPTDAADAPPDLYKAIQEQLGLKLEAAKAPTDVLVVDHVEKPSAN